jgi:hypothetical protein
MIAEIDEKLASGKELSMAGVNEFQYVRQVIDERCVYIHLYGL